MEKISVAFYLQHYLSPSMTFIYRQLMGVSQEFNTQVFCTRKLENETVFPFENINFYPQNILLSKLSRVKETLLNQPAYSYINIEPKLSFLIFNKIKRNILEGNSKLIHAHFGPSGIEALPIAKKLQLPLLVSFHGYDASTLLHYNKYKRKLKELFKYALTICPSAFMINHLQKYGLNRDKAAIVRCGIPLNIFNYKNRESIRNKFTENKKISFLQVSNFVEKKGHNFTLEAFSKFLKHYSNAELILAGDGPLLIEMKSLAIKLGITDKVVFPGLIYQEEVRYLLYSADVFVHHSILAETGDMEGIPTVIMEAMASGLPVISTYHSGIPELVENNINGFLVPEKDVDAYSNAMIKILEIDNQFGINGRRKIEQKFNLEIENKKLISIYEEVLKSA